MQLTEGFASMYGLELLATVHCCALHAPAGPSAGLDDLVDAVHAWSPRKRDMFTPRHISVAWKTLDEQSWLVATA